ncbi:HNH endonuclease [Lysinibacillus sphaericus]|nr:HNH endonuclease [Lysinibacillus sphaericus]
MIRVLNTEFVISVDDLEEANFQTDLDSDYTDVNVDDIPKTPQRKKQKTGKKYSQWDRKKLISKKAIKLANFKCEIDDTHETFISETSNKMFMEAHHLIPLRNQNEFEYDLDIVQNIVSICPNCHRKIHLAKASEKQSILETLFEKRKDQLELMGHNITEKDFLSLYGIVNK